jgi:hypothetical protein
MRAYKVVQRLSAGKLNPVTISCNLEDAILSEAVYPPFYVVSVGRVRIACKHIFNRKPVDK